MYFWIYTVVFLISEFWRLNRPKSTTEYDPETSNAENEIERLQSGYRRRKYKIKASLKNSRKQEKIINQLKLKNEMLNKEKQKELQALEERYNEIEMEKQRLENENQKNKIDLQATQEELKQNEMKLKNEAEQLKNEKLKNEKLEHDKLKIQVIKNEMGNLIRKFKFVTPVLIAIIIATTWQVKSGYENDLQSCEHEDQKHETNLQEKQKELQAFEDRLGELKKDNQRLGVENQKYKNDLQKKQKELQANTKQYKTFINYVVSGRTGLLSTYLRGKRYLHTLSGYYHMVEIVNDRPVYKRNEKDEYGNEIYLWYNETTKSWGLTYGSHFQARNDLYCMGIDSQEYDVKKLGTKWHEFIVDEWKEDATVRIS